ncbi:hypothetical protein TWF102_006909 [Orbilia oligospora]|uniref:Glucanase n=1 Tax=Orbilia oligospora TaxID=2813651 RepID=A0A7C8NGE6_ORBOL|nr:hypothetical protein TWF103_005781 [Orbilia oligospora]KAF3111234.1 hypothetical protein TWF102_006909 [Orbilia oligospora]KAF3114222.1 hypothetical protein TWF706_008162 [Orbilia oligospora]KAF3137170.1 hypothetical protein TWF594_007682 [Orbilia oligospora]
MAFKYAHKFSLAILLLPYLSIAQGPDTLTPEYHPKLPIYKCTKANGCLKQDTSVVLDWNTRSIHTISTGEPCKTSIGVDRRICPNQLTCFKQCVVEGLDYYAYGVSTSGDALQLSQFSQQFQDAPSPRVYLLGADGNYVLFKLKAQEITFEVDVSQLPCGENGALYLAEMMANGGKSTYTPGGANYGGAYCDAQCPHQDWKNGNLDAAGPSCCSEMDIFEANSQAVAFTPHPCVGNSCDKSGCGFNPYAAGHPNYWGPGKTVDTTKPITVVTQFLTDDGSPNGELTTIRRKYVQNGQEIASASIGGDVIQKDQCPSGEEYGGLVTLGKSFERGMVLVFSIWNDPVENMNWLDSGNNGPCDPSEGSPENIRINYPYAKVKFSKIRYGEIDSTLNNNLLTSTTRISTTTTTKSTTPGPATQTHWGQCGGIGFPGPTICEGTYTCYTHNSYYGQCL